MRWVYRIERYKDVPSAVRLVSEQLDNMLNIVSPLNQFSHYNKCNNCFFLILSKTWLHTSHLLTYLLTYFWQWIIWRCDWPNRSVLQPTKVRLLKILVWICLVHAIDKTAVSCRWCEQNWRQVIEVKTVFSSPHRISRLDKTVSKFSVADSLDLSQTLFTPPTRTRVQHMLVVSTRH